jgi:GTP pyrophosphokinase
VARALAEHERARTEPAPEAPLVPRVAQPRRPHRGKASPVTVVGVGNLLVQMSKCCQPLPGEPIRGYLTRGRGVSVHRADCATFLRLEAAEPGRVLPVEWSGGRNGSHEVDLLLDAIDRKWLLKDLTNLIAQEDAHVLDIHSDSVRGGNARGGRMRLRMRVRVADFGQLSRLLGKIEAIAGIERARRA